MSYARKGSLFVPTRDLHVPRIVAPPMCEFNPALIGNIAGAMRRNSVFTPWTAGINFRATSGFVSDQTGETYCLADDNYPTSRGGFTFGWESGIAATNDRDRVNTRDRRLAGINYDTDGNAVFRIDIPSVGTYDIRLAAGDPGQSNYVGGVIKDNTTTKISLTAGLENTGFTDAAGNVWALADWPANNVAVSVTFSSTILRYHVGTGSANVLSHIYANRTA